jgi:nucleoside-diphosphate-sugar epimerase
MLIFLTGATGYIGSAVLDAYVRGGHDVTVLVRDPAKAKSVAHRGVKPVIGDLSNSTSYAAAAEASDVIVHTAIDRSAGGPKVDRQAIDTLIAAAGRRAASGTAATFIYTSGLWVLGPTQGQATEDFPLNPTPFAEWRPAHEQLVLAPPPGVRAAVIRPGIVYGGARGIIGDLLKDAANGLVRVIGDGRNHWPCVYDRDLADLYVRVATHDAAGVFHANDEADERVADIVEAIARHASMRPDVRNVPLDEARKKMGPYAEALALDQIVRSPRAHGLGWAPTLHSVSGNVARLLEEFRNSRAAA